MNRIGYMTVGDLREVLKHFPDDAEVTVFNAQTKSVDDVIMASQNGNSLQLTTGDAQLHRLAGTTKDIVMNTPVSARFKKFKEYKELETAAVMYEAFHFDDFAKKLLDAANIFAEKFSECNLTRTLEPGLEDYQYLYV